MIAPKQIKICSLGGGTGLSTLLAGLKYVSVHSPYRAHGHAVTLKNITAIVTVSDDGGSSGRIRDQYPTPAPGDIRNCLVALASDESLMTRLFRYRFRGDGDLGDHSLGNLLLTALTDITGDFHRAVQLSSQVLAVEGTILPSTTANVTLGALLADGSRLVGERNFSKARAPIERVFLEPQDCQPLPEAIAAIRKADVITLGPGSLFTSLVPNLLVREVAQAIQRSSAVKVYIANLMTEAGETDHFTASDHLKALTLYTGGVNLFEHVLVNVQSVSSGLIRRYARERASPVDNDTTRLGRMRVKVYRRRLLREDRVVRHHPVKLARALLAIFQKARETGHK